MRNSPGESGSSGGLSIVTKIAIGALLLFLGFFGALAALLPRADTSSQAGTRQPAPAAKQPASKVSQPVLRLESWSWSDDAGWVTAEGQITNSGAEALEHVEAVVSWLTDEGTFITSQSALIEYDPLLSGQTSPWKVMARHNPAMSKARVEFKRMFGGKLPHVTKR